MGYLGRHVSVLMVRRGISAMKLARSLAAQFAVVFLALSCVPPNAWSAGPANSARADVSAASSVSTLVAPGPLRSFLRMAGISQKVSSDEVLPLLAHNIFTQGYEGSWSKGRPTEFLVLLTRYVHQAKELQA